MKIIKVQLIPKLVGLTTNVEKINCFTFWNTSRYQNFFSYDEDSPVKLKYFIGSSVPERPDNPELTFSHLTYKSNKWYYKKPLGLADLRFFIDENTNTFTFNRIYNRIFIKLGRLEPPGDILTDYVTNKLESLGINYQYGSSANYAGKTCLFFGFGKNFKTTLVNLIVNSGGYYIGEEFFLLKGTQVYATIPNIHRFDFRPSHKEVIDKGVGIKKIEISEYRHVFFLQYSNQDQITEISLEEANSRVQLFNNIFNTYYYRFFQAKDLYISGKSSVNNKPLVNQQARYFVASFTRIENVFDFIKKL